MKPILSRTSSRAYELTPPTPPRLLQGGSMHMFSSEHGVLGGYAFIGEGIPVSLGAAFKVRYMRDVMGDESADQVRVV